MLITFYATVDRDSYRPYMPPVPVLLPASSFYGDKFPTPRLPEWVTDRAADSGGFVATVRWGYYRYTPAQYVHWLEKWSPRWAATMDFCCEPEIAENAGIVRERQQKTTEMAHVFWHHFRDAPWSWTPTIQGWETTDYIAHARELKPLITTMAYYYAGIPDNTFRVGIGTLCRRASSAQIREIAAAVSAELPGIPLHLWGIKMRAITGAGGPSTLPPAITSIDSAAWNGLIKRDKDRWRASGLSCRQYAWHIALPAYLKKLGATPSGEIHG